MKKVVIFDVDKTLARSKEPIAPTMAVLLTDLLTRTKVAIISGDSFAVLEENVISKLPPQADLANLSILTTSGGALYAWQGSEEETGGWRTIYEQRISEEDARKIEGIIESVGRETELIAIDTPSYGPRVEYRGAQITLSALGQHAPIVEKEKWDPDGTKKRALREALDSVLPGYDVKIGGATSVDITKEGVNKAYGVEQLSAYLGTPIADMLYIGDALFPGGNDEVVKASGIETRAVHDPADTEVLIRYLLELPTTK